MRCFIGIDLSVEATKEIERLQRIIKPHFVGKTTSSENLHLTLKFLGEIEDATLDDVKKMHNCQRKPYLFHLTVGSYLKQD